MRATILLCIKHLRRYGKLDYLEPEVWEKILFLALRGLGCETHHLDFAQRMSIYEVLKGIKTDDPYLKQFIEESKEMINDPSI